MGRALRPFERDVACDAEPARTPCVRHRHAPEFEDGRRAVRPRDLDIDRPGRILTRSVTRQQFRERAAGQLVGGHREERGGRVVRGPNLLRLHVGKQGGHRLRREHAFGIRGGRLGERTRILQLGETGFERGDTRQLGPRLLRGATRLRLGRGQFVLPRLELLHPGLQFLDALRLVRHRRRALSRVLLDFLARDALGHGQQPVGGLELLDLALEVGDAAPVLLAAVEQLGYERRHAHRVGAGLDAVDGDGQFLERRAAREESIGAHLRRECLVLRPFDAERQQEHRQVAEQRVFLQAPAQREAVDQRQEHVAHDCPRPLVARDLERLETRVRPQYVVTTRLEQRLDRRQVLFALVGQQNGTHRPESMRCRARGTNGVPVRREARHRSRPGGRGRCVLFARRRRAYDAFERHP